MNDTPNSNRTHIAIFGRRNAGKSSIINAIANQDIAIVSDTAGTTTDPVKKAIEINGIGACTIVDTAGFDDEGELGTLRIERTKKAMESSDIALLVFDASFEDNDYSLELKWKNKLESLEIPIIAVLNKIDLNADYKKTEQNIKEIFNLETVSINANNKINIDKLIDAIKLTIPKTEEISITGHIIKEDDIVMLVMPQDIQAPKGRLILPQVQTLRNLLDKKCVITCVTTDMFENALEKTGVPDLIITDSQVFKTVYEKKPEKSRLTSFSVLFAGYKGDIAEFVRGASAIGRLNENSRVLIAEACTHAPLAEDIGREKIPRMLRQRFGQGLKVDIVSGSDFPEDLSGYDIIIHCGGCMFNRKYVLSRIKKACTAGVPITNYGVAIAFLSGILDKIDTGVKFDG